MCRALGSLLHEMGQVGLEERDVQRVPEGPFCCWVENIGQGAPMGSESAGG